MNKIGRRFSEYINDLPEHLKKDVEKNFGRDELAAKICKVLDEQLDGVGTIDEILIALVKFENVGSELKSRRYLLNKLYRMAESEKILEPYIGADGNRKKGTYRLPQIQPAVQPAPVEEQSPVRSETPVAPAPPASGPETPGIRWKTNLLER